MADGKNLLEGLEEMLKNLGGGESIWPDEDPFNLGGDSKKNEKGLLDQLPGMLMMAQVFLAIGDGVVEQVQPVVVQAIQLLTKAGIDVYKDLAEERKEIMALGAKAKYAKYGAYVEAGFSKTDAFKLILAEIKPVSFTEVVNKVVKETTARLK